MSYKNKFINLLLNLVVILKASIQHQFIILVGPWIINTMRPKN